MILSIDVETKLTLTLPDGTDIEVPDPQPGDTTVTADALKALQQALLAQHTPPASPLPPASS